MKFLIDENLPQALTELFAVYGQVIHVKQIQTRSDASIKDAQLNRIALYREYVIVTRDDDFVKSHVSRKVPEKLIFIHSGQKRTELLELLRSHIKEIINSLRKADLIELSPKGVRLPFEDFDPEG